MNTSVVEKVKRAPKETGVYIFRGKAGRCLYVGKALRLRDRLRSYMPPVWDKRPSVLRMVDHVMDVEWLVTRNEKEALILENNLIKSYRPKYNIMYRDDKSYLSLKMTRHDYPRLYKTRKIIPDGSTYFGPFSSVASVNQTLKLLQKVFMLRDCTDAFFKSRVRPCLSYQIKLCSAPCVKKINKEAYLEQVLQIKLFMKGQFQEIIQNLKHQMLKASENMSYELAAHYRDQIHAIEETLLPQNAQKSGALDYSIDAVGVTGDAQATLIKLMKIRKGKLIGADEYYLDEPIAFERDIVRSFLQQYYLEDINKKHLPHEILLPCDFEDMSSMEELFSDRMKRKFEFKIPQRGRKKKYVELANQNAKTIFLEKKRQSDKTVATLKDLQNKLRLPTYPKRIEGFDISNFQGHQSYGSQVVFIDGEKDSQQYRIYGIRTVQGPDDFKSMHEVLSRRVKRINDQNQPDLLLIDGGKGQLSQAVKVMEAQNMTIPLVAIAKEKTLKTRSGIKYAPERLFLPGQKNAIVFPASSPVLHLLQRIRDEAHRFGLKHHRQQRKKVTLSSELKYIQGVGIKRQKALLKHFGSIPKIKLATLDDLMDVPGMNQTIAQNVLNYFLPEQGAAHDPNPNV